MRFAVWFLLLASSLFADELKLRITPRWHEAAIAVPSAALTNDHGQVVRLTRLAALISGVTLRRPDGSAVRLDGQYGFIDAADGRLSAALRNVPRGDYVGVEFQIGLPPEINHADPAHWPAGHPLNPLVNRLHWGWQGGFVFLALEGRWRAPDGVERGFSYHLATDSYVMPVRFLASFRVEGATTVGFAFDFARVLGGRELVADGAAESTHSGAGDTLAGELATATARAFFWLEASSHERDRVDESDMKNPLALAHGDKGPTPYALTVPAGFPQPVLPADNPLTVEGVELGRRLFRDRRLSGNGRQSCASCHEPEHAFSDRVAFSRGADGKPGARNAMPLLNLAWSPAYAWDGGRARVRDQTLAAMTNPVEMHADAGRVAALLGRDERVRADVAAAFGTPEVTAERMGLALEQYLLAQVSANSKFDRATRGELALSEEEKRGFALFATEYDPARGQRGADCFHCHGGALFSDFAYKNNGLDRVASDRGRAGITGQPADEGKFKTPSLRNVSLTAPYMHDGRFETLEEVVAHYDHGVQNSSNLDPNLAKHPADGMKLDPGDQRALVAFLRTLTDARFEMALASPRYSSPSQ